MRALVEEGVAELGRLDIVSANAGIATFSENAWSMEDDVWEETIAVNLTGVWKTLKAAIPAMIDAGNGGSIVITSSTAGIKGMAGIAHYDSSKHGVVGLMRTLAIELAPALDPGQHRAPHRREHADGRQRLHGAVPRRRLRRRPT